MKIDEERLREFLVLSCCGGFDLEAFIHRAYRDMCRTLHGIAAEDKNHKIFGGAKKKVVGFFSTLEHKVTPDRNATTEVFDEWHSKSCEELIHFYEEVPSTTKVPMRYGHAQKWINMTFKYGWLFGGKELAWLDQWLPAAHVPVDKDIREVVEHKLCLVAAESEAWSQWGKDAYESFQNSVRKHAKERGKFPLELEFDWWLEIAKRPLLGKTINLTQD